MKHVRSNCGHWLHFHCLDSMLTTPPFLHYCTAEISRNSESISGSSAKFSSGGSIGSDKTGGDGGVKCGRKIGHPDWSDDVKHLERAWLMEQAKKRELVSKHMQNYLLLILLLHLASVVHHTPVACEL